MSEVSPCGRAARMMASSCHSIAKTSHSILIIQPHRVVALAILGPAFPHLDEEEEVDAVAEQALELEPGAAADALDLAAFVAEHDRLLPAALDSDGLADLDAAVLELLPRFGLDGRGIGQLVMELEKDLLARRLGGEQALRHVGELILGKQEGPLGQRFDEMIAQIVDAAAGQARDHEDRLEDALLGKRLGEAEQLLRLDDVDLVEGKDGATPGRLEPIDDAPRIGVDAAPRIDQQDDHVGILRTGPGSRDHGAFQPALGREDPRRIDEDELRRAFHDDTEDAGARRLHLGRDDRDLGAHELVEQRRLAGIRRPDQRDIAAASPLAFPLTAPAGVLVTMLGRRDRHARSPSAPAMRARSAAAAATSAARFDVPAADSGARSATLAATVKRRSCAGPSIFTVS